MWSRPKGLKVYFHVKKYAKLKIGLSKNPLVDKVGIRTSLRTWLTKYLNNIKMGYPCTQVAYLSTACKDMLIFMIKNMCLEGRDDTCFIIFAI